MAGWVYFIHAPEVGRVKIGIAVNPPKRLMELQVGSPVSLRLLGVIKGGEQEEAELHSEFYDLRIQGEWFRAASDLMEFIQSEADPWESESKGKPRPWGYELQGAHSSEKFPHVRECAVCRSRFTRKRGEMVFLYFHTKGSFRHVCRGCSGWGGKGKRVKWRMLFRA